MARTTPRVRDGALLDAAGGEPIAVGSPAWFAWLEQAAIFAFAAPEGTLTARKERQPRGAGYWRAYRTSGGRQRRAYLGRSSDLTLARLRATAARLAGGRAAQANDTPPAAQAAPQFTLAPAQLLPTKLAPPRPRPARVERRRLLDRLDAGLTAPLTLLVAPAGFGKTTLLANWLAERVSVDGRSKKHHSSSCAWLSLDDGDNDPTLFLRYLIAGLQSIAPAVGMSALARLGAPQPPAPRDLIAGVVADLTLAVAKTSDQELAQAADTRPKPHNPRLVLVLDDYHAIAAPAIHEALALLIDRLPAGLRVLIASREDPPLPLARMRARGQLVELRAADLRFTEGEAAAFLSDVMGLRLSAAQVAALEARTEGWASGLQLAALAIQGAADRAEFIAAFAGSNRYILDYLTSEVLDRLPPYLRAFMLRTSVLDRMCAELCDAVVGVDELASTRAEAARERRIGEAGPALHPSSLMLAELDRLNLFLFALDDRREWYRYHTLFAEVLRAHLRRELSGAQVAELRRRAGEWFSGRGQLAEAIPHLLAAGQSARAAGLIGEHRLTFVTGGQSATLLGWLAALPAGALQADPGAALAGAWAALYASMLPRAEELAALADRAIDATSRADAGALRGEVATVRALIHGWNEDDLPAIRYARQALADLPEQSPLRVSVAAALSTALIHIGDLDGVEQTVAAGLAAMRGAPGMTLLAALFHVFLSIALRLRGRLRAAERADRETLRLLDQVEAAIPLTGSVTAYHEASIVLYEQNRLDEAEPLLRRALELAEQTFDPQVRLQPQWTLARLTAARGDADGARAILDQAVEQARRGPSRITQALFEATRAILAFQHGGAADLAVETAVGETLYPYDDINLAPGYALLAAGRSEQALAALDALGRAAEARGRGQLALRALIVRALAHRARGEAGRALELTLQAIERAAPEGYVRAFVDEGAPMAELLAQCARRVARRNATSIAIEQLLAAFPSAGTINATSSLVEPLSPRELEVLRLLAAGHDNAAIAERLIVAVSTVKSHVSHILGKLGARSRLEAVLAARRLGLLPD